MESASSRKEVSRAEALSALDPFLALEKLKQVIEDNARLTTDLEVSKTENAALKVENSTLTKEVSRLEDKLKEEKRQKRKLAGKQEDLKSAVKKLENMINEWGQGREEDLDEKDEHASPSHHHHPSSPTPNAGDTEDERSSVDQIRVVRDGPVINPTGSPSYSWELPHVSSSTVGNEGAKRKSKSGSREKKERDRDRHHKSKRRRSEKSRRSSTAPDNSEESNTERMEGNGTPDLLQDSNLEDVTRQNTDGGDHTEENGINPNPNAATENGSSSSVNETNENKQEVEFDFKDPDPGEGGNASTSLDQQGLELYNRLKRLCMANNEGRGIALDILSNDMEVASILPQLCTFISNSVTANEQEVFSLTTVLYLLKMIKSLLKNKALNLEDKAEEIIDLLLRFIILRTDPEDADHWMVRDLGVELVMAFCRSFNSAAKYVAAAAYVREKFNAVLTDSTAQLASIYGAIRGLGEFGEYEVKTSIQPKLKDIGDQVDLCEMTGPLRFKLAADKIKEMIGKYVSPLLLKSEEPPYRSKDFEDKFGYFGTVLVGRVRVLRQQQLRQQQHQ